MAFLRRGEKVPEADLGDLLAADDRPDNGAGRCPGSTISKPTSFLFRPSASCFSMTGLPEEIALLELDDPLQVGLEDGRLVGDVVAVEHELGFEAQGVAGAEADGQKAERLPFSMIVVQMSAGSGSVV